jgi:hypothetical protein
MSHSYADADCEGCGMDTMAEFYMLHDQVWALVNEPAYGAMLCVGCVESRIGRRLTPEDFNWDIPLNHQSPHRSTMRLNERMGLDVTKSVDWNHDAGGVL